MGQPAGIAVNRHDDSSAFQLHGRWWMFLATGTTGLASNHGVNLLYSSADFKSWRREHSLTAGACCPALSSTA